MYSRCSYPHQNGVGGAARRRRAAATQASAGGLGHTVLPPAASGRANKFWPRALPPTPNPPMGYNYAPCPPPILPSRQEAAQGELSPLTVDAFISSFTEHGFAVGE